MPPHFKDISNFVINCKIKLIQNFKGYDGAMTGYLNSWDIKQIFQTNGFQNIQVEGIEQFAQYFGVCDNNKNIYYLK